MKTKINKTRIDITIEDTILKRFRKIYVNKKGDLSNAIQEMMYDKLYERNNKRLQSKIIIREVYTDENEITK